LKRWVFILIMAVALGSAVVWRMSGKKAEAAQRETQREARRNAKPTVSVAAASVGDVVQEIDSIGSVEPPYNVRISAEITGRILAVNVHEGENVRAGQELVVLDAAEISAEVEQKRAALSEAKYRLAQASLNLNPTVVSTAAAEQQRKADLEAAEVGYTQAKETAAANQAASMAAIQEAKNQLANAEAAIKTAETAITIAEAQVENARTRLNRVENLHRQGFIAAQDVDDAKTGVKVALATLAGEQSRLNTAKALRDAAASTVTQTEQQGRANMSRSKSDVEAARSRLTQARASLEVARANQTQPKAFQRSLEALQSSVSAAEAALRNAEAKRANTRILCPIDGVVSERRMDPGAVATPGAAILNIQAVKSVWITAQVPEEVQSRIRIGMVGDISLDALPGRRLKVPISQVLPAADPASRQFPVRFVLQNPDGDLRPGMFSHVRLTLDRLHNVVTVPREAVQGSGSARFVFTVDEKNTVHRSPVIVSGQNAEVMAVKSGLSPGDRVVVLSAVPLKDGQQISISEAPTP
jgi:RND family efflux transporter MFP subunit